MTQENTKEKKIGYYLLGKTIGEGTFGKVKLATHTLTGEKVAIKILVKQKIIDVADVERVSRQIHILKLIRHPSIIQLYEIIETSRHLFLVMQYVEQGELFDYIVKQGKVQQIEACKFFKNIISGVSYLHELNIVHRDLKPENLLIDWKGTLKIVDFGLSNTYKAGQLLKTACGSPCYAAPEMISSKKYNGLEVDIWSCGVILFAMVCGYLPFEDSNTSQLYKKILSGEYVLPNFISQSFKDLLQKILNVNPSKRFRLEEMYNHEWSQMSKDIPLKSGIIVGYHRIPVDRAVLKKLQSFSFDLEYAERCIQANKHNHITTTYYLLLKKNLRSGHKSNADLSDPLFDYGSIQPFKRIPQEKKFNLFGNTEDTPTINLENTDIHISGKGQKKPQIHVKPNTSKFHQKSTMIGQNHRSNKFFEKQKKQTQYQTGGKKFTDLRMYLKPVTKSKQYYSEVKKKNEKRNQSLYYDPRESSKDEEMVIRMQTDYSEEKSKPLSRGKYQRVKISNRISRALKEKEK